MPEQATNLNDHRLLAPDSGHASNVAHPSPFARTADPEHMADQFERADLRFVPIERGFAGFHCTASLDRAAVVGNGFFSEIMAEGEVDPDAAAIMLVTDNESGALHNGELVEADEVVVYGPGASHSERGRGHVTLTLMLPASEIQERMTALLGGEPPTLQGRRHRLRLPRSASLQLQSMLSRTWAFLPHATGNRAGPTWIRDFERDLVDEACVLLSKVWADGSHSPAPLGRREALLREAIEIINQAPVGPMSLPALCGALGVSNETLRQVFREFLGVPPMKYVKLRRTAQCRELLKAADPQTDNVKTVAFRCGIWELGRFAGEYRRMYGEMPSDTLHRA